MYSDLMLYHQHGITVITDVSGMAHSLEIRAPFLDHRLLEFVFSLPRRLKVPSAIRPSRNKYILKRMAGFGAALELGALGVALGRMEPGRYLARLTNYQDVRGMSRWHDIVDWIGGYPFEVATPDSVFEFCRNRGFTLVHLKTSGGKLGCNEFVFQRD